MTIKEVAQEAGVSVSTVSKIINNKADNISPATIERVLEIAKKNHYVPYGKIKTALHAKGFTLGVMLRSVSASPSLLRGVISGAQEQGYAVLTFDSDSSIDQEEANFRALERHRVDGLLWEPVSPHSQAADRCGDQLALQVLDQGSPAWYDDQFRSFGYLITEHLISMGHSSIAFVKAGQRVDSSALLAGYKQALYDQHIPFEPMHILAEGQSLPDLVTAGVTAFVCANPVRAAEVITRLTAAGFTVPGDASVIALAADVVYPSEHLSLQRVPYEAYGRALAEDLITQCEARSPERTLPQPQLDLTGQSTIDRPATARKKHVIVLGSINADITLNVRQLPSAENSTTVCHSISTNLGGKGANQAMGVAKLGWPACLISKVGNDPDAAMALQQLNDGGVRTEGVRRDLDNVTGKAYIHVQEDGESILTLVPGANSALTAQYVESMAYLFQNAGYCLLSSGPSLDCVAQAAKLCRKFGVKTIFKPSSRRDVPADLYPLIDILIPNRHAAKRLAPVKSVEEQAQILLDRGAKTVIITLGHQGCYLRTANQGLWYDAPDVTAVDSTGAADAFIAALAVHLLQGAPPEEAVEIASHAAGFCVTRQGVIPALVTREELEQHLSSHPSRLRREPT